MKGKENAKKILQLYFSGIDNIQTEKEVNREKFKYKR